MTKGLENLPNGVKGTSYIDCPCHHASDRQYRSHAFYRAQRHQWEVGLSSPNRILDKNRKHCGAATSFWHQRLRPRRDQLLFIELIDLGGTVRAAMGSTAILASERSSFEALDSLG